MRALPADPGHLIVSCDGASRGNPGPAGIGAQITCEDGTVLGEIAEGIGETTNNVAEYTAAIEGLSLAKELGAKTVTLRSDSQLLINQLTGRYRVKSEHLQPLYRRPREPRRRPVAGGGAIDGTLSVEEPAGRPRPRIARSRKVRTPQGRVLGRPRRG